MWFPSGIFGRVLLLSETMKRRHVPPATPKPQTDLKPPEPETMPDGNYFDLNRRWMPQHKTSEDLQSKAQSKALLIRGCLWRSHRPPDTVGRRRPLGSKQRKLIIRIAQFHNSRPSSRGTTGESRSLVQERNPIVPSGLPRGLYTGLLNSY
jgi:hypothetical protein